VLIKSFYDPEIRKQGREEGLKEGLKEGKLMVAKRMLSLNMDLRTVVLATELPEEEVKKLRNMKE